MEKQEKKLGLWLLVFVAIGSMIGSGIFNSPKDLINIANPLGASLAWIIGGLGALTLALVFVYLNHKKPELKSGIFAYAKEGFGDYMGFNAAWGYWSLGWLGNVSYFLIFFKTLNDLLGEHSLSPLVCFIMASGILWAYHFIVLAGVKESAILNFAVTVAKLVPIALVIVAGIFLFNVSVFNVPDWKNTLAVSHTATTPVLQIKSAMAIVLWCFVGIEAASVLSSRATSMKAVRNATILSLFMVLAIYLAITVTSMASIPAHELGASATPLALVLEGTIIGNAGGIIVKTGLMISVIGASLSWILLSTETMYAAAKDGVLPAFLAKQNKKETPVNSLLFTQVFTQIFLLSILSPKINETYVAVITVGTTLVLIPYLLSSMYAVKISWRNPSEKITNKFIAILGTMYSAYVIYAVGIKYLFLSVLFYALGTILFLWAKKERKESIRKWEWGIIVVLVIIALIIVLLIATKKILIH